MDQQAQRAQTAQFDGRVKAGQMPADEDLRIRLTDQRDTALQSAEFHEVERSRASRIAAACTAALRELDVDQSRPTVEYPQGLADAADVRY